MAPALEIPSPPSIDHLLQAQQAVILRLFHGLGGGADWFAVQVWPLLRCWASMSGELSSASAPQQRMLTRVLAAAAAAAEQPAAGQSIDRHPSARLERAHASGFRQLHQELLGCEVRAACGQVWDPARQDLRGFLQRTSAPHQVRYLPPVIPAAVLCAGAKRLVDRGVWSLEVRTGRCYLSVDGCALLWPLAAADLGKMLASPASPGPSPDDILAGLAAAGLLAGPPASALRTVRRADGRLIRVLIVQTGFARAAGLPVDRPPPSCQRLPHACGAA